MAGINWGDAPTWLAVAVASAGGWIALRQLRDQQDVIRRQTVQLERQQAEQIKFFWQPSTPPPGPGELIWMGIVSNKSSRPIRDVVCRIQPHPAQGFDGPALAVGQLFKTGIAVVDPVASQALSLAMREAKMGPMVQLIRAGERFGFKTEVPVAEHGVARMMVRFTDDAGLHWEVDPDLHLAKLDSRSW